MKQWLATSIMVGCALAVVSSQSVPPRRPAVPLEPISAVLDAFAANSIVALGEGAHGNEQSYKFRIALIHDPRFAETVNDIIVESGNALYQPMMDRFIGGADVPIAELRRVWQDTTSPNAVWDSPIYEEFFREVRAINATLPPARRLRVLLSDPPGDWNSVHSAQDLSAWINRRSTYRVDVIRREVLAKGRRALLVYGDGHLPRLARDSIVYQLEHIPATRVFSIWTNIGPDLHAIDPDVALWPVPSLALLRNTALGAATFASYISVGNLMIGPRGEALLRQSPPMEAEFDAALYLGPRSTMTMSRLPPQLCAEPAYMQMRLARMALRPMPPGVPDPGDQLKRYCAAVK